MASSLGRSLYVGLKADTKDFGKALKKSEGMLDKFKKGAMVAGAAVGAAFAAMGLAALKFGMDAVNAAIEDEKSQKMLARTIKNNTKAHQGLNKAAEKTIDALMWQFNIADDKLRPAFGKLVTATKSVSKSQKIMRTAIDISAGTGKSLDTVVTALSRAYLGNNTAVGKLGIGIDKAKLKTMSFEEIVKQANTTFKGSGKDAANTYAGAVDGLKIAWSEFQESVGYKILPYVKKALTYIKEQLLPWLGKVKEGFDGVGDPNSPAVKFGEALKRLATALGEMFKQFGANDVKGKAGELDSLATSFTNIADSITELTNSISNMINMSNWDRFKWLMGQNLKYSPYGYAYRFVKGRMGNDGGAGNVADAALSTEASGGPVRGGRPILVGENGPEMFVPSGAGGIRTASQTRGMLGSTVININGVIDADSARRSIEQVLRNSAKRIGPVDLLGSAL
jgi:hypothetical protein